MKFRQDPYLEVRGVYRAPYDRALREHVWLLRAEGMSFVNIGRRLDISDTRARQLFASQCYYAQWATRRTRWWYARNA